MGKPHGAHAALSKQAVERVAADDLPLQTRLLHGPHYGIREKSLAIHLGVLRHQVGQIGRVCVTVATKLLDAFRTRGCIQRQQLIEQRAELLPTRLVESTLHGSRNTSCR
jgi:hypothetical protein